MNVKLTAAQRELLENAAGKERGAKVASSYRPFLRLLELGLVSQRHATFGGTFAMITPEGRAALLTDQGERS